MKSVRVGQSRRFFLVLGILLAASMSGCATVRPMAIGSETKALDLNKESVLLMTMKVGNGYKTAYQPQSASVIVVADRGDKKEVTSFTADQPYSIAQFNDYLVSMNLAPGKYRLRGVSGWSGTFPIRGGYMVPIYTDVDIPAGKVIYLGHVEAIIRERKKDDELRAGPVIPLLDQAVAGFSGGTFDVKVVDNFDGDMPLFLAKYPMLKNYTVERHVLPEWKQPTEKDME